jgi:hypothetical protein
LATAPVVERLMPILIGSCEKAGNDNATNNTNPVTHNILTFVVEKHLLLINLTT